MGELSSDVTVNFDINVVVVVELYSITVTRFLFYSFYTTIPHYFVVLFCNSRNMAGQQRHKRSADISKGTNVLSGSNNVFTLVRLSGANNARLTKPMCISCGIFCLQLSVSMKYNFIPIVIRCISCIEVKLWLLLAYNKKDVGAHKWTSI